MALPPNQLQELLRVNGVLGAPAHRAFVGLLRQGLSVGEALGQLVECRFVANLHAGSVLDPAREMDQCAHQGIRLVAYQDEEYPANLRLLDDAPLVLYVRGRLLTADAQAVAVVGSRLPSVYGRTHAERLGKELAESGLTVVSGLAQGIDQAAHRGTLSVPHGRTLAVLGSGLDRLYPKGSELLVEAIASQGAVLSEFALGTEPQAWNFPRRNRIISGLSRGVLVVEAHLKSGSLITARLAAEQGREVFAMPGPVDHWTSRGTHQLLREGAALVESAQDVVQALAYALKPFQRELPYTAISGDRPKKKVIAANKPSSWVLQSLKAGPLFFDELIGHQSEIPSAAVKSESLFAELLELEMSGWVRKQEDGRFALARAG